MSSLSKNKPKLAKIIVIVGPTASGKTRLAVKLAQRFNGEIISADSRQVYRGMDIGTGKDLKDYKQNKTTIPYHLIDIINPNQKFNVAKYKKLAIKKIQNILKRGKLPIVVGGTGLYTSAIVDNYDIPKIKPNLKTRQKLVAMTLAEKIKLLKKMDPASLKFMDLKNPRRIDRALEVCLNGQKFSANRQVGNPLFNTLILGINFPKNTLDKRIDLRVGKMIAAGLKKETKKIIKKYGLTAVPLETIGYKEMLDYLNKKTTLEQAVELIKIHTHQFAKRQMTWFSRNKNINWIKNYGAAKKTVKKFL